MLAPTTNLMETKRKMYDLPFRKILYTASTAKYFQDCITHNCHTGLIQCLVVI